MTESKEIEMLLPRVMLMLLDAGQRDGWENLLVSRLCEENYLCELEGCHTGSCSQGLAVS